MVYTTALFDKGGRPSEYVHSASKEGSTTHSQEASSTPQGALAHALHTSTQDSKHQGRKCASADHSQRKKAAVLKTSPWLERKIWRAGLVRFRGLKGLGA